MSTGNGWEIFPVWGDPVGRTAHAGRATAAAGPPGPARWMQTAASGAAAAAI